MPKTKSIEEATSIMPDIIAETVVLKAAQLLNTNLDVPTLSAYLVGHAEATYAANTTFRKKINSNANKGNSGRDYLHIYMQHWLSSRLLKSSDNNPHVRQILIKSGFAMGRNISEGKYT